ncbi:hypothetical protein X832_gp118 [Pseudomonas phage PAK_P5]|uniref:Uncharacterized protein n=1 Tax=Pseudomonas phage PAK_P5 TaxID=1327964 RepID=V5JVT2_9CAUD|nr:hypothetical protein X832_gp118 [Pseudomonas phage PAK_P5]AGR89588.1 hypothetical protein PAK_P500118 [Pseudomonas phage PAK_P5]
MTLNLSKAPASATHYSVRTDSPFTTFWRKEGDLFTRIWVADAEGLRLPEGRTPTPYEKDVASVYAKPLPSPPQGVVDNPVVASYREAFSPAPQVESGEPRARGKVDYSSLDSYIWSQAPLQANFFSLGLNGELSCWLHIEEDKIVTVWTEQGTVYNYRSSDRQPSVPGPRFPRPQKKEEASPQEWDGEGLPPVGCTVQLVDISSPVSPPFDEWLLGDYLEVIAHKEVCGTVRPVVWNDRKQTGSSILPRLISPVSQETLAAEKERQQGIQEMVSLVSSMDLARALEVLYDAGYRKQEDTE